MDIIEEKWEEISGYEGYYFISDHGKIKSVHPRYKEERILRATPNSHGYLEVILCKEKIKKKFTVHKLVALNFIINHGKKPCLNHKDGNKLNNRADNLEWCTHSENNHHACQIGLKVAPWKNKTGANHNISKKIIQLSLSDIPLREFGSTREVERILGYNSSGIANVARGNKKTAYGYKWKYA